MTHTKVLTLDQYWEALAPHLPSFQPEDQQTAVTLYRELAKGQPVDAEQLGRALGVTLEEARTLLERDSIKAFIYPDGEGRVLGFGGLAAAPMHHRFDVDGRTLWTWCAWDSLFIPEILGKRAHVVSPDPVSGELVQLVVTPHNIEAAAPSGTLVSFLLPDAHGFDVSAANVMAKFCHFVFFFGSRVSGERWMDRHPGTFLFSLAEAFALAQRLNERNFGSELAKRASAIL
ncbi:MAG: organomercurial lyase [bacterium]